MKLQQLLAAAAEKSEFSGVAVVSRGGARVAELASGYGDREQFRLVNLDTVFGTASIAKGMTAVTIGSLVDSGHLDWSTQLRSLLDAPFVDVAVTVEHLLGHRSGAGDYIDEEDFDPDVEVLTVPPETLQQPSDYLEMLSSHPQVTEPGERFAYNNSGFVLLSLAVEAATGRSYFDAVQERVFDPAEMHSSGFPRIDDLPEGAAVGYLSTGGTNSGHLPVRGAGDGGLYSTAADLESFWLALTRGDLLEAATLDRMVTPVSEVASENRHYGLGFWLDEQRRLAQLEGMDAGVSAQTGATRSGDLSYAILSNSSTGAWPLVRAINAHFGAEGSAG